MDESKHESSSPGGARSNGNGTQIPIKSHTIRVSRRRRRRGRKRTADGLDVRTDKSRVRLRPKKLSKVDCVSPRTLPNDQPSDPEPMVLTTYPHLLGHSEPHRKIFGAVRLRDHTQAHIGDTYIQPQLAHIHLHQYSPNTQAATPWMTEQTTKAIRENHVNKYLRGKDNKIGIRELPPTCGYGGLSVETRSAPLCVYSADEVYLSDELRIDRYYLLYNPARGNLFRLFVKVFTPVESALWRPGNFRPDISADGYFAGPSRRMLRSLLEYLLRQEAEQHDQRFYVESDPMALSLRTLPSEKDHDRSDWVCGWSDSLLQQKTGIARHWDIPWYTDGTLYHCQLYRGANGPTSSNQFLAWLHGRWVLEWRFGSDERQIDAQIYTMEFFHTMSGRKGFANLHGVVRDRQNTVTAFLMDIPAKGHILWALTEDVVEPPDLQRREKWCQQLVEIVREAHSHTKVIGSLDRNIDCGVAIDENDDLILYNVKRAFLAGRKFSCNTTPPEYQDTWRKEGCLATMESDLYQLGFLLWWIYGNRIVCTRQAYCGAADCESSDGVICTLPRTDSTALPMPPEIYPEYLREAISAC